MKVSFVTCDVFTNRPFTGNPLLVVPDATGLGAEEMQAIAREINYSESTFVLPAQDPRHAYLQRTFVPVREIPYAGHPTVGTAMVMSWLGRLGSARDLTIEVGFGPLRLKLDGANGAATRVTMEQGTPSWGDEIEDVELLGKLASATSAPFDDLLGPLKPRVVSTGNRFLIVPLGGVASLAATALDPRILALVEEALDVVGVYLFAFAANGRIRARSFCPGAGVPEDPATGSAAGPLGVYLAVNHAFPGGVPHFTIDQGLEMGRPSEIEVEVLLGGSPSRPTGVLVSGSAVKMMEGTLDL